MNHIRAARPGSRRETARREARCELQHLSAERTVVEFAGWGPRRIGLAASLHARQTALRRAAEPLGWSMPIPTGFGENSGVLSDWRWRRVALPAFDILGQWRIKATERAQWI